MVRPHGFSLIEMLVVLFVIVLMTSLVTLNVNSGASERVVQERAESLIAVAAYALDEAQFSGSDFGVLFVRDLNEQGEPIVRALWRQRLAEGWRAPLRSTDVFDALAFPPDVRLQLLLDGEEVLPAESDAADPQSGSAPQWLLVASGETQPGEMLIRSRDTDELLWTLRWDPLGRFELFRGDAPADSFDYADAR